MLTFSGRSLILPLALALPIAGCSSDGDEASPASNASGGTTSGGATNAGGGVGTGASVSTGGIGAATGGAGTGSATSGGAPGSGGAIVGTELLHGDFETHAVGAYTEAQVGADFGATPDWNNGLDEGRATIVEEAGNNFLRVTYTGGEYGPANGGVQFMIPLGESSEELYLSYRVRFAAGFDFVKGGKLPGLVGGSAPTGCIAAPDGFSARGMWRTGGAAVQYMYFPEKVQSCGDDYPYLANANAVNFARGTWHTVAHRLVMNTAGQHDGILQAWFDGELVLDLSDFLYRATGATYGIDALYFSTFFGGSDASWAPETAQIADFDDFVITKPN